MKPTQELLGSTLLGVYMSVLFVTLFKRSVDIITERLNRSPFRPIVANHVQENFECTCACSRRRRRHRNDVGAFVPEPVPLAEAAEIPLPIHRGGLLRALSFLLAHQMRTLTYVPVLAAAVALRPKQTAIALGV